jgi:hypothetical protein
MRVGQRVRVAVGAAWLPGYVYAWGAPGVTVKVDRDAVARAADRAGDDLRRRGGLVFVDGHDVGTRVFA